MAVRPSGEIETELSIIHDHAVQPPRLALQTPAHAPEGPWPRQVPPPELRDSRPDPTAYCGPLETRTLT